jgi:hypothetical protein
MNPGGSITVHSLSLHLEVAVILGDEVVELLSRVAYHPDLVVFVDEIPMASP